jgi:diguanylate cyclase (GGDEF)-like protein/PAS domain S-box-containing protein
LQAVRSLFRGILPAYLLTVFLLAFVLQDRVPRNASFLWAVTTGLLVTGWGAQLVLLRKPRKFLPNRAQMALSSFFAFCLSSSYSWFLVVSFPWLPPAGQVALAVLGTVLGVVGTLALAPLPRGAALWLLGLGWGILVLDFVPGHGVGPGTGLLLGGLGALLAWVAANVHRSFLAGAQAEHNLARQNQTVGLLLHDFGEGGQDWLWTTDREGRLTEPSAVMAQELGQSEGSLPGQGLVQVLVEDPTQLTIEEEEELDALGHRLAGREAFHRLEVPAQVRGQHRRWKLSARPILDEFGDVTGWMGVGSDITEVQRLGDLNARLALLDNLTGLANRHRLQEVLHDLLSPRNEGRPCGLILLDVENFRMVNEGLGHEVGDDLLREIALRLRTRVPGSTLLARLGGDEFALVAPGAGDEALEGLVAALRSASEDPFQVSGHRLEVTFQMGLAACPQDAVTATELLKCAELALHAAKAHRGGAVRSYEPALNQVAQSRIRLHGELKSAVADQQFELWYQPQIRLADGTMGGAEALVRWNHASRGRISPADFIPALEETGLIVPLGIWILESACREALTWPETEKVAVNVSAVQFASRSFLDSVFKVLQDTGLPPGRLDLEITESVMAQDPKHVVQILDELRRAGVSISLDDFGTGYSSLSYLRTLPLDKLKVDQSFVRTMGQDPQSLAIVRTVLDLSRHLGLKTTAEGVETVAQRDRLTSLGCDMVQGYLYSKPLPPLDLGPFRQSLGEDPTRS